MKVAELRSKSVDQLKEQLAESKRELMNLRFQKATGELEKTSRIREVRRTVAKVKTLLTQAAKQEKKHA